MTIGPGSSVDLILKLDPLKEKIDVRRSLIYDAEGDEYILSQTTPPVRFSQIGKPAGITRVFRQDGEYVRMGFSGTLFDIIRDYRLGSSRNVLALCIRKTSRFEPYNLRMHYRVRPGADWPARISVDLKPVILANISLGGALFTRPIERPAEPGQTVEVTYTGRDAGTHSVRAVVRRAWTNPEPRAANVEYVAVQFIAMDKDLARELGREIMILQRGALTKV